jgi:hypothetical protein
MESARLEAIPICIRNARVSNIESSSILIRLVSFSHVNIWLRCLISHARNMTFKGSQNTNYPNCLIRTQNRILVTAILYILYILLCLVGEDIRFSQ